MAINQKQEWDESMINDLYKSWQQQRDGVAYDRYAPILEAAKRLLLEKECEKRIQLIQTRAANMRAGDLQQGTVNGESQGCAELKQSVKKSLGDWNTQLLQWFEFTLESLSFSRLVPVAVAAALVVAVLPFVYQPESSLQDGLQQSVASLGSDKSSVSAELERLGEYTYAFSSGQSGKKSGYASAFVSGVAVVDVRLVDRDANPDRFDSIASTIGEMPGVADVVNGSADDYFAAANNAFLEHELESAYLFGQWVESTYLLSQLAFKTDDVASLKLAIGNVSELRNRLDQSGFLTPRLKKDLSGLEKIAADKEGEKQLPRKASAILLKLRTLESRSTS